MYTDSTIVHVIGQLLIAFLFVATALINASTKFKQHLDRMVAVGVPFARFALIVGFAMQIVGGLLIAFDTQRAVAAGILIVFTIFATGIFHQFWRVEDPLRRHLHVSCIFSNCAIIGGLLLLI